MAVDILEEELKSKIYSSVDKGLAVAFVGGVLLGISWYILNRSMFFGIVSGLASFMVFLVGRFLSLKFLFDENIECELTSGADESYEEMDEEKEV